MRILVLQFRRLGDVLMTTPMLRAIGRALPGATVDYCVEPSSQPAIRGNPHVHRAIAAPDGPSLRLVPLLRRSRYDVVIDTLGSPSSARLALLSGAPRRIGPARRWRRVCYTDAVTPAGQPVYSALGKLSYLSRLGIHDTDCRLELFPSDADEGEAERLWASLAIPGRRRVVAFAPVSRRPRKRWPAERFAAVCDAWAERANLAFLPLYGPGEEPQIEGVVSRTRCRDAFLHPCPTVPFGALLPLMRRCVCYFGNDNGIRHVAVAAGIPTAAVFGPPDPLSWTPPGSAIHAWVGGRAPVETTTVDAVSEMFGELIDALPDPSGGRA